MLQTTVLFNGSLIGVRYLVDRLSFFGLAAFFIWSFVASARAAEGGAKYCPLRLETTQKVEIVPDGFVATEDGLGSSKLKSVDFFDGPVDRLMSMHPSSEGKDWSQWVFQGVDEKAGVWVACHYSRSKVVLSKRLPEEIKRCAISYFGTEMGLIEGSRPIRSIECQ